MSNVRRPERPRVRMDWREYFDRFCAEHGEPEDVGGRLLFRDGHGYSRDDYAGPEYAPPEDPAQLAALERAYWTARRKRLLELRGIAEVQIDAIERAQEGRSVAVVPRVRVRDQDTGHTETHTVTADEFRVQLGFVEKDVAECDRHLEQLRQGATG